MAPSTERMGWGLKGKMVRFEGLLCVFLCVSINLSLFVCFTVLHCCLSVCVPLSLFLSVRVSLSLSAFPASLSQCHCLCLGLPLFLSLCGSLCLSLCASLSPGRLSPAGQALLYLLQVPLVLLLPLLTGCPWSHAEGQMRPVKAELSTTFNASA